ncbi:unnamed protein product [Gongylonema pulchrum]|uniref:Senescence domain-containing protein n=1 Tax=Gongylonema pulchrum TaxID=637853 RepID=A0A183CV53_9BILA|nr:unnamed protein product [Gongylonema pulchrum]
MVNIVVWVAEVIDAKRVIKTFIMYIKVEEAREMLHGIYKDAIQVLIAAAQQAKIAVGDDPQNLIQKHGITLTRKRAEDENVRNEFRNPELKNLNKGEWNDGGMTQSAGDSFEKELGEDRGTTEENKEDFDLIQDSYKRIVGAAAECINKFLNFSINLGREAFGVLYKGASAATSLQKAEKAFQEEEIDPKKVLQKAREAAAQLEMKRSIHPEYTDLKFREEIARKKAEDGMVNGAVNMIKGGLEKAASIGSEAVNTLAASSGYHQDSNFDGADEMMSESSDKKASSDESEQERIEKAGIIHLSNYQLLKLQRCIP